MELVHTFSLEMKNSDEILLGKAVSAILIGLKKMGTTPWVVLHAQEHPWPQYRDVPAQDLGLKHDGSQTSPLSFQRGCWREIKSSYAILSGRGRRPLYN